MDLTAKSCVPCKVGAPTLSAEEIKSYLAQVSGWSVEDNPKKISKELDFKDFKEAIEFVNKVAALAEKEGHHPNIYVHSYKKVKLELWTHKIGGLQENDFILAAKIDKLTS